MAKLKKKTGSTKGKVKSATAPKKPAPKKTPIKKTSKKPKKVTTYKGVAVGAAVPSFRVTSTGAREFSAEDLKGKTTILYFYPKDNTPGCTLEGHDFKARHGELQKLGAQVLGVSRDSIKSHENFKTKCGFQFELLSDEKDQLGKIFDVIQMKQLYGRVFEGIERSTFVIDAQGRLRREWRKVKVNGHAAEVVTYIRNGFKE